MSTNVTLHAGHDVAYFTSGQGRGGCAGAMSYYTAAGEPPGQWAGKGAAALGLNGQVDPDVIERLYQDNIGPGGELLVKRRQSKAAAEREAGRGGGVPGRASVRQRDRAGRGPRGRTRPRTRIRCRTST